MTGAEIAERTLAGEDPGAPCIMGDWVFNPEFYRAVSGRSIAEDPLRVAVETFRKVGANLTPQLAIPTFEDWHPFRSTESRAPGSPEEVRDEIEQMPDPRSLERDFDIEGCAEKYARRILEFREIAGDDILLSSRRSDNTRSRRTSTMVTTSASTTGRCARSRFCGECTSPR
ncbi:MAG: hypothetical protein NTU88_13005 [Armatimonadetes bacterium]|nr:hypothetical protein [Armatimonadota bacterium]